MSKWGIDHGDAHYVRTPTVDTVPWKRLGFEGQTVLLGLRRQLDRAGVLYCDGAEPWEAASWVLDRWPEEHVRKGMEILLKRGWIEYNAQADLLRDPFYEEIETTPRTSKGRMAEMRRRRSEQGAAAAALRLAASDAEGEQGVTECHATEQVVTAPNTDEQAVTGEKRNASLLLRNVTDALQPVTARDAALLCTCTGTCTEAQTCPDPKRRGGAGRDPEVESGDPDGAEQYREDVERAFLGATEQARLLVRDEGDLVEEWRQSGIPAEVVCRAILERCADRRAAAKRMGETPEIPKSLKWYRKLVYEAWQQHQRLQAAAAPVQDEAEPPAWMGWDWEPEGDLELWERVETWLAESLDSDERDTWLGPARLIRATDAAVVVGVPNDHFRSTIEHFGWLRQALDAVGAEHVQVEIRTAQEDAA